MDFKCYYKSSFLICVRFPVSGDSSCLRKLSRCAELVQKSAVKLLSASEGIVNNSTDTGSESDMSVLSDTQTELLEYAVSEVKSSTASLISLALKHADPNDPGSPTKTKRMLPVSPEESRASLATRKTNHKRTNSIKRNLNYIQKAAS